ncbi:hypothetical protein ABIE52_000150 [Rhodococcus sp. OAS809]
MSPPRWVSPANAPPHGSTGTASTVTWDYKTDPAHRSITRPPQRQRSSPRSKRCDGPGNGLPSRITFELRTDGIPIARRTVTRILRDLGLNRRRFIDPNGETTRKPQVIAQETIWSDGPCRCEESRKNPGRRRLACPRPRVRAGQTIPTAENPSEVTSDRLHLPAFRDRRQHPFGVHRGTRQRNRCNSHRFHEQRPRLLRCTRNHLYRARDHRQRIMLSGSRFHIFTARGTALPDQAVHAETQREGRTLQPYPRRGVVVLPRVHQRSPASHCR